MEGLEQPAHPLAPRPAMTLPAVNYLTVLVAGILIFILGGLWYSPILFAKPWIAAMGRTEEDLRGAASARSVPLMYLAVFIAGTLTAWVLAIVVRTFNADDALAGAITGALCWLGFAGATSFGTSLFSLQPTRLWVINSLYNLASMMLAGAVLAVWR
jgi:hypothetical protein